MVGMEPVTVRPERTTLAVVLVVLLGALPLGLSWWWTSPVLLVPLAALVYVLRARVVATSHGLEVCNGLAVHEVAWDDVEGFQVPDKGTIRVLRRGAEPLPLRVVTRRDLLRVMALSPRQEQPS
jgi:hypothetical protein